MTMFATVNFQAEGYHRWADAPSPRSYLGSTHRHIFHVTVFVEVKHNDREIEYHDLLEYCRSNFATARNKQLGTQSCEDMAVDLCNKIILTYPDRCVRISVFEDGENGATYEYYPKA